MSDDAPEKIGLVKSPFGWALYNSEDFTPDQVAVRYVRAGALDPALDTVIEAIIKSGTDTDDEFTVLCVLRAMKDESHE